MKLELRKSDWLDDWYIIEIVDVEPKEWLESIKGGFSFQTNTRISDADVEGTAQEMLAIADAIEERNRVSFKRCAVDATLSQVQLWSPRNSQDVGTCERLVALGLAKNIKSVLEGVKESK